MIQGNYKNFATAIPPLRACKKLLTKKSYLFTTLAINQKKPPVPGGFKRLNLL